MKRIAKRSLSSSEIDGKTFQYSGNSFVIVNIIEKGLCGKFGVPILREKKGFTVFLCGNQNKTLMSRQQLICILFSQKNLVYSSFESI